MDGLTAAPHDLSRLLRSMHKRPAAKRQACALYQSPAAAAELPVYEDITITWDPTCLTIGNTIDLYLNVQQPEGLLAVHKWTGAAYANGTLETQFKPTWWNASTGAGSVSAQVSPLARSRALRLFGRKHALTRRRRPSTNRVELSWRLFLLARRFGTLQRRPDHSSPSRTMARRSFRSASPPPS